MLMGTGWAKWRSVTHPCSLAGYPGTVGSKGDKGQSGPAGPPGNAVSRGL